MRLKNFMNEEKSKTEIGNEIIEIVKRDCKPFLKEMNKIIWRGSYIKYIYDYKEITPRKDRRPLDTASEWHKWADDYFSKHFGWKARSEGVFATFDKIATMNYGNPYIFFPIGNYKYIYSPKILDFYNDITEMYPSYIIKDKKDIDPEFKKVYDYDRELLYDIMKTYTNKDLNKKQYMYSEVMFKCKSYYLINERYADIMKTLF